MTFIVLHKKRVLAVTAVVLAAVVAAVTLSGSGAYAVFYGNGFRKLPIYRVDTDEKKIAISFDCAWGAEYTDSLLDTMAANEVKCTFFTVEFWTKKYPDYIAKIDEQGHEIGTHSATHPKMSGLNKQAVTNELSTSVKAIEDVTQKKVTLFRPPFGDYNDNLIETAEQMGLYVIQWDVDSLDWKNLSAKEIFSRVVNKVQNGSIVLFHNNGLHTAEALPLIIATLKNKGFKFVPIGELIYKTDYIMLADGTQARRKSAD